MTIATYNINGRDFVVRHSSERIFIRRDDAPPRELLYWIDHANAWIVVSVVVSSEFVEPVVTSAVTRARLEACSDTQARPLHQGCKVLIVPATQEYKTTLSGCFPVTLIPWPWW